MTSVSSVVRAFRNVERTFNTEGTESHRETPERFFASLRWYENKRASKGTIRARSTDPEGGTPMIHVGADLHERFCYMTALDATGRAVKAGPVANRPLQLRR